MKIRIYETDFDGRPVECSGEYFSGKTALDIVEGMTMNPFQPAGRLAGAKGAVRICIKITQHPDRG